MKRGVILLFTILLIGVVSAIEPINPNALPEAKAILDYIEDLPNRANNRVIISQQLSWAIYDDHWWEIDNYEWYVEGLQQQTGKWPAMIGQGFFMDNWTGVKDMSDAEMRAEYDNGIPVLIDYWNAGGLINLYMIPQNPWLDTVFDSTIPSGSSLIDIITPGSQVYDEWMRWLDNMAYGFQQLEDAGVVVLFRPPAEMNYRYGWWGHRPSSEYIQVYQHMFDYFTNTKGLDNILWVYGPNAGDRCDDYYPGDSYVDIVGMSVYKNNIVGDIPTEDCYNNLTTFGKPIAFTEHGSYSQNPGYDNMITINGIRSQYPMVSYVNFWCSFIDLDTMQIENINAIINNTNAQGLMDDPWIITRDELDWLSYMPQGGSCTHPADKNGGQPPCVIDSSELNTYINTQWRSNQASIIDVIDAMSKWKAGSY